MSIKQYAERDAMKLDQAGGYYCRHVSAMTAEQLNSKGDIAAELGWRDMQIARLNEQVQALAAENANMRSAIDQTIGWQESVDAENTESVRALFEMKTPATDAILNEVRAHAVEGFMAWSDSHIEEGDEHEESLREVSKACKAYAARIRAGEMQA